MKICLLNSTFISQLPDYFQRTVPSLRTGIASIAAYLRNAGHEVSIIDPQAEGLDAEQTAQRVIESGATHLGLTAYTLEICDAADIAAAVKRRKPDIAMTIGGYHFSALPEDTLREFPIFDCGIVGEGELSFAELLAGQPLASIPGAAYRTGDGRIVVNPPRNEYLPFDEYPDPAWDLYPDLKLFRPWIPVEAIRACPHRCSFCFKTLGNHIRYKSPARILREIEQDMDQYGVQSFSLASGGTFPVSREHGMELFDGIIRNKLPIRWWTAARVDLLDEPLLARMKEAGCYHLNIGVESGDPKILEECQKGFTLDQVEKAVRWCHKLGMETDLNFIIGFPHETPESIRKTRQFAAKLRNVSTIAGFAILTPYPGTKVYDMAVRNEGGLRLTTRDWRRFSRFQGYALEHENFAPGELRRAQTWMFLSYYLGSPRKILNVLLSSAGRELLELRRILELVKRILFSSTSVARPARSASRPEIASGRMRSSRAPTHGS